MVAINIADCSARRLGRNEESCDTTSRDSLVSRRLHHTNGAKWMFV